MSMATNNRVVWEWWSDWMSIIAHGFAKTCTGSSAKCAAKLLLMGLQQLHDEWRPVRWLAEVLCVYRDIKTFDCIVNSNRSTDRHITEMVQLKLYLKFYLFISGNCFERLSLNADIYLDMGSLYATHRLLIFRRNCRVRHNALSLRCIVRYSCI